MLQNIISKIAVYLQPTLLIPERAWVTIWLQRDRSAFLFSSRVISLAICIIYALHYPLVDIPAKKEPLELWAWYRASVAGFGLLVFLGSFNKIIRSSKYLRIPTFLLILFTVYMQGQSMIWRQQVPFFYVPLFAFIGTMSLRLPIGKSILAFLLIILTSYSPYMARPADQQHLFSASIVALLVLIYFRSNAKNDIESFIHEKLHEKAQQKLIETQIEMNEQLRGFLPKEIYQRLDHLLIKQKMSPLQALDELLRPKKIHGTVLYSDIRGFTGLTKTYGDEANLKLIIPAQKQCTDAVEDHHGIPRLSGDLIYAFYDSSDKTLNLIRAIESAFKISEITQKINEKNMTRGISLRRYSIITCGELLVGNLGGSSGSRDITVLGNAANLPSRIDVITKDPHVAAMLKFDSVILSAQAKDLVKTLHPNLILQEINLKEIGITLKDFEEETCLYICLKNNWECQFVEAA